jgi:beta-N-acetylhexosaminidase
MAAQGAFILGCAGPRLSQDEAAFFRAADPLGFILFARNVETPDQLRRLTSDLRASVGRDAPVLIDQEGGRVQRLRAPHWREWLPPLEQVARAGPDAARSMYQRYRIIAEELRAVGIDANCAPCGDVATDATHPFLRNRCYGTEAGAVAEIARAVATGLMAGGVLPVMKHMPGHGRATVDSHEGLPRTDAAPERLTAVDFAVFRKLSDLPLGMTAHVVYDAFDDRAATVSRRMIRLIREEIGFDGLLMTDDISMGALGGTVADRVRAALAAGCDVVLHCHGSLPEMEALAPVAGRMGAEAQARADRALRLRGAPQPVDIAAVEAELEALLSGRADDRS